MHSIQKSLLKLAKREDLGQLGLRKIGEKIGVDHPQQVKYHLQKLIDNGRLVRTPFGVLRVASVNSTAAKVFNITILGQANCGEPLSYADETDWGSLTVSPSLVKTKDMSKLFAVKAVGNSMNRAQINDQPINDGDYVVVDASQTQPPNGSYVVSSVGGLANIKKYIRDEKHKLIKLLSESSKDYPPIIIDPADVDSYQIHGTVVRVFPSS